jgi:hypothetical protein
MVEGHSTSQLPVQVAELAIEGVEQGLFFSKSPDLISNIAISSMAGVAPKIFNTFIEFLLLPFYFFLHLWIRWNIDKRILTWRNEERAAQSLGECMTILQILSLVPAPFANLEGSSFQECKLSSMMTN